MQFIAEFCQNHNGDFYNIEEMVHQAAEAGATYGKIQTIFADDLTKRERFENGVKENAKIVAIKRPYQPEYERLKMLDLTFEQHDQFISICSKYGIIPMTTCFTRGAVDKLSQLSWDTVKIASYDCGSKPLIEELAEKFNHLIISTGASYDDEIENTANLLTRMNKHFSLLHCVTIYPTPLDQMHLCRMEYLKQYTSSVGLSDHSLVKVDGIKAVIAAIFMGADIIERHFTIFEEDQTKDGPVSIRPEHLIEMMEFAKLNKDDQKLYIEEKVPEFNIMQGKEKRSLTDQELLNRDYYRGRFATHVNEDAIYNWQDTPI